MKKIGIDVRMIEHSGIGVRILNLVQHFAKEKREGLDIYLFGNSEILGKYGLDKEFKSLNITRAFTASENFLVILKCRIWIYWTSRILMCLCDF